jgi:hypothetical protein
MAQAALNKHDDDPTTSDSESDEEDALLSIQDGLSLESLLALQHFQAHGCFDDDDNDDGQGGVEGNIIPTDTICVSYTPQDSQVIAETYRRLQLKSEESSKQNQDALEQRWMQDLVEPCRDGSNTVHIGHDNSITSIDSSTVPSRAALFAHMLKSDGVVRINHVLSVDLAAACLQSIEAALIQALQAILASDSVTGQLFRNHLLPESCAGVFHEFSALTCDPTAASQPIHPDAKYAVDHLAPMWTVFVALQDVELNMGATVFLPGTHTEQVHADLNTAVTDRKNQMLAAAEYRRSTLKAGDCAIMDARTLHFGSANTSDKRRVLLYFTIRNPAHGSADADFPGCGSLFTGLHMTTSDFV